MTRENRYQAVMAPEQLNKTTRRKLEPLSVAEQSPGADGFGKTRSCMDCVKPIVDGIPVLCDMLYVAELPGQ